MTKHITKRYITTALFVLFSYYMCLAQLNLKVGYTGSLYGLTNTNMIFDDYNNINSPDQGFEHLRFLQGIDLGVKYRIGNFSTEIGWNNIRSKNNEVQSDIYSAKWRMVNGGFYFGAESHIGPVSLGGQIEYAHIRMRERTSEQSKDQNITSLRYLNPKLFIALTAYSDMTAFTIRPFYQIPSAMFDTRNIDQKLLKSTSDTNDKLTGFGISIFIYNGPQPSN